MPLRPLPFHLTLAIPRPQGQSRLWLQQLLVEACIVGGQLAAVRP